MKDVSYKEVPRRCCLSCKYVKGSIDCYSGIDLNSLYCGRQEEIDDDYLCDDNDCIEFYGVCDLWEIDE